MLGREPERIIPWLSEEKKLNPRLQRALILMECGCNAGLTFEFTKENSFFKIVIKSAIMQN
jgi:hypothetical protein